MAPTRTSPITPSDIARMPGPGLGVPVKVAFSHDARWIAWLYGESGSLQRELYLHNIPSGDTTRIDSPAVKIDESSLSLEEKLRRERSRDIGHGIANYSWFPRHNRIMVPTAHQIWTYDIDTLAWSLEVEVPDSVIVDPHIARDGEHIAWVQDGTLTVARLGGEPRQLTHPIDGVTHGLADFIAQEELSRSQGFWWSHDGTKIAYEQADERDIPLFRIQHLGDGDPAVYEDHRYPFAGAKNPKVTLHVVDVATGLSTECELGETEYLARVRWSDAGDLYAHVLDRSQTRLTLRRFPNGQPVPDLITDHEQHPWVNVNDMFRPLANGQYLQATERTGFCHLEVVADADVRAITAGDWLVDGLAGISGADVFFTATKETPTERHLYRTDLKGAEPVRLTTLAGMHNVAMDREAMYVADLHSAIDRPPRLDLLTSDGAFVRTLVDCVDQRIESFGLRSPELTTVTAADGSVLHCAIYRPDGNGPFPTVDSLYGGPHVQLVANTWGMTANLRAQYLRDMGICVVVVDSRGSARRGLAFEAVIHRDLGNLEVQDHVAAIAELGNRGVVDIDKVGVYGWSYGGYLAAMCLARAPQTFKVAVSGAPVTHWDGYDTCYTERYMGLPSDNPVGYQTSSVMEHVKAITGRLLIVHGLLDENVHFRHTARLVNALVANGVDYELMFYPNERHLPRGHADRTHMESRITEFLLEGIA